MKKIKLIQYLIMIICIITYIISIFDPTSSLDYFDSFITFITLTIFIYICGLVINEEEHYKHNITLYYILYFIMLFSLTMFIRRYGFTLINKESLNDYFHSINLIPFKTINSFISDGITNRIPFYNIFGNLTALMPLSFLLMLKDDKNINFLKQIKKLSLTVLIIEVFQLIFNCGIFDIDDFILNISGALILYFILVKTKLINKIKKLFYTDFKLPNIVKYILLCIFIIIEVYLISNMLHNLISTNEFLLKNI